MGVSGWVPLLSGNGLSVLSKRNAQRSRFGTSTGGYVDSVGIVSGGSTSGPTWNWVSRRRVQLSEQTKMVLVSGNSSRMQAAEVIVSVHLGGEEKKAPG